ncbi:Cysteine-rich receptor-like protein kinase 15 [Morella rubra]|uniref:Cysteine-rich receptor-like protein kinase 15 n=1 Tax=Morella rubra TaxID=262757 RepID=A0A6A1UL79_9ROSI|nr:Cysteine-rich receptor-like protein kinase 15 [Morella rubra]
MSTFLLFSVNWVTLIPCFIHPIVLPKQTPGFVGKGSNSSRTVLVIAVPIVVSGVVIISFCICVFYLRLRKQREEVEIATGDFSDANKLGKGGFGFVYKGALPNGKEIAVKRLSKGSAQGDTEFKNEVMLVGRLQHRNLVRLLGFCLEGDKRLLVYEFLPNASLDNFIFDRIRRVQLNWEMWYKIIKGIARGLLYLHEDSRFHIIHCDLKASNILLDKDMTPKIADFGTARLFVQDQTQSNTNRIVGTYGYMPPEYVIHGNFSVKFDVFSFGVLVLEIVTGRKNTSPRDGENEEGLLGYAWKNWRAGTASKLVDPTVTTSPATQVVSKVFLCHREDILTNSSLKSCVLFVYFASEVLYGPKDVRNKAWRNWSERTASNIVDSTIRSAGLSTEMMRCIHMGLLCIQDNVADRPTMASIVLMLNSYSTTLPVPSQPAFFLHSTMGPESSSQWEHSIEVTEPDDRSKGSSVQASANEASISDASWFTVLVNAKWNRQRLNSPYHVIEYKATNCSRSQSFLSALFIRTAQAVAQTDFLREFCLDKGSYTANSTYEANLNDLLSSLSFISYRFYNSSYGEISDRAYAIGLCRGDVPVEHRTQYQIH